MKINSALIDGLIRQRKRAEVADQRYIELFNRVCVAPLD